MCDVTGESVVVTMACPASEYMPMPVRHPQRCLSEHFLELVGDGIRPPADMVIAFVVGRLAQEASRTA